MIYIRDLFLNLVIIVKAFFYIDNIALVISITSFKKNIKILKRKITKLYKLKAINTIKFDLAKTEHFNFFIAKKAKSASLRLLN